MNWYMIATKPPARGSPADLSAGVTRTTHTHSHSAPGTWRRHCCSMCSRMASAPGCPGHRCCLQTGWASRWGPRSSPWLHGAAPSRGALPHSRWPLHAGPEQEQTSPRSTGHKRSNPSPGTKSRLCCSLFKTFFKIQKHWFLLFFLRKRELKKNYNWKQPKRRKIRQKPSLWVQRLL